MTIFRSGVSAMTNSARSSTEYKSPAKLLIKSGTAVDLMQFGLSGIRKGALVTSAPLRIHQDGSWLGSTTLTVQRNAAKWLVSKLNWGNKPGVTGTAVTQTQSGTANGAVWTFDVTSHVQAIVDGTVPNYGWRVSTSSTVARYLRGFNTNAWKPTLEVVYSYAPAAPTSLHPSAGAVSIAKPTLRWDSAVPSYVRVQVDPAANGTTPSFDSGLLLSSQAQFDLAGTAFAGLADGASTQWRAMITDTDGRDSAWSQWATFSRVAKPVLTITQPTGTVTEASPPVVFAMTGMVAFQVLVAKASAPTAYLYDSGKIPGTVGAHSPANVITVDGASYVVTVRAWDSVARESTPGDSTYVQASVTTTLAYDPSVSGVSDLAAEQAYPAPWVNLKWLRAVQPDGWAIIRDGAVIHTVDVANDLLASGTMYEWRDWTAQGNAEHTYRVAPIVNGVTSSVGPLSVVTVQMTGVWLGDPETGSDVLVVGREEPSASYGEESTTFNPLGAIATVDFVTAQRGLEGSVSGLVTDVFGRFGADEVATLFDYKGRPGEDFRLVYADVNIPVFLRKIDPIPRRAGTDLGGVTRSVAFTFNQTGELPYTVDL